MVEGNEGNDSLYHNNMSSLCEFQTNKQEWRVVRYAYETRTRNWRNEKHNDKLKTV